MRSASNRAMVAMVLVSTLYAASTAAADDSVRVYGQILSEAETVQQKYSAATSLAALDDPAGAEDMSAALDWALAARSTVRPGSELESYERLVQVLVRSLGDWRYTNAASSVMRACDDSGDPMTRAEALMALGSMRAVEYAEKVAIMLRDLNAEPAKDADAAEKVAYGCVIALERMHSPAGFSPLFFASEGWYSRRVREQAEASLALLLDDPSDAVAAILAVETPPRLLRALALELRSGAPAAGKVHVAGVALRRGIALSPRNRTEQNQLSQLRVDAMNALVALGGSGGTAAADIAEAYRIGPTDERLVALKALGADRTPACALALAAIIEALDKDQKAGVVDETRNLLMRAALQNAAASARKELAPVLQAVRANDGWSSGVLTLAAEAIKAVQ